MEGNRASSISRADSLDKMGEFWDSHDFTEFDTDLEDVEFEVSSAVRIEVDILSQVERQAQRRGVTVETLVNLWLQQKLAEQACAAAA